MKRQMSKGFTLIELMIVVAIIGILAAIAVPNFMKFQARARQSEAKVNLKAWGTGAKSYFAEYNTWGCGACGWKPDAGNRYSYNVNGGALPGSKVDTDTTATTGVKASGTCTAAGSTAGSPTVAPTGNASGNIDSDVTCDTWTYDPNANYMQNLINDVDL